MKVRDLVYIARRWRTILVIIASLSALAFVVLLRFANLNTDRDILDRARLAYLSTAQAKQHPNDAAQATNQGLSDALKICSMMFDDRFYLTNAAIQPPNAGSQDMAIALHGTEQRWALFPTEMDCRYHPQTHAADGTTIPGGLNLLGEYQHVSYPPQHGKNAGE